jgi:hypothetical protein
MSGVKFHQEGVPGLRAVVADVPHHFIRASGVCVANGAEARDPHLPSRCGRVSDDEHCSKFRSSAALNGTSCAGEQMGGLAGCGKTISAQQSFHGLHVWDKGRKPRRMLKKAVQQGRSERRGEGVRSGTLSL